MRVFAILLASALAGAAVMIVRYDLGWSWPAWIYGLSLALVPAAAVALLAPQLRRRGWRGPARWAATSLVALVVAAAPMLIIEADHTVNGLLGGAVVALAGLAADELTWRLGPPGGWSGRAVHIGGQVGAGLALLWAAAELTLVPSQPRSPAGADCRLMAAALRAQAPGMVEAGVPIASEGACDWRRFGLRPARQRPDDGSFSPWVAVSTPRYSLLRTKAVVEVGGEWISLGGSGEQCAYRRAWKGWRKGRCHETWIS